MSTTKPIVFTKHALIQCEERGATKAEVEQALNSGSSIPAKANRLQFKLNFQFNSFWQDQFYSIKQVAPIVIEETERIVVITVYTFYF